MIKIYKVSNGEDLTIDGEREKIMDSFAPRYIHVRNDNGDYMVVVITPEIDMDYKLMDETDPEYTEIYDWVNTDGVVDAIFDTEITGTIQ